MGILSKRENNLIHAKDILEYQCRFTEKDDETGYNHFEARDYNARDGRWLVPDQAGQFWSSYVGKGFGLFKYNP